MWDFLFCYFFLLKKQDFTSNSQYNDANNKIFTIKISNKINKLALTI